MNDITYEDVLAHYGVQGMHWGTRKRVENTGPNLTRKQKINNALIAKRKGPNRRKDERSQKTVNLGKAETATNILAFGSLALGVLSPEPVSKGALLSAGILSVIGSVTLNQLAGRSAGDDALRLYGKK